MSAYIKLMKRVDTLENELRQIRGQLYTLQCMMLRTVSVSMPLANETPLLSEDSTAAQEPSVVSCETSAASLSLPQTAALLDVPFPPSPAAAERAAYEY